MSSVLALGHGTQLDGIDNYEVTYLTDNHEVTRPAWTLSGQPCDAYKAITESALALFETQITQGEADALGLREMKRAMDASPEFKAEILRDEADVFRPFYREIHRALIADWHDLMQHLGCLPVCREPSFSI
ncbi:MAG: hypothetical protein ACYDGM_12155 [Vulcanimicrobiaceae bacterium]